MAINGVDYLNHMSVKRMFLNYCLISSKQVLLTWFFLYIQHIKVSEMILHIIEIKTKKVMKE